MVIGDGQAFATGYYEPEIAGSRTRQPGYQVPIYGRPDDLVDVDLGQFAPDLKGRKIRGQVKDGALGLYPDRQAIVGGAIAGRAPVVAWAHDPIEVFFLQVQGSGLLRLPGGGIMRVGYATQNGRDYTGIGKYMKDRGLFAPGQSTSMQGIMARLRQEPDGGAAIMDANRSFVFFRELGGAGPLGAMGYPVMGRTTVAADPAFTPLGAPLFLSMDNGAASGLWVAQDTGGAIKGANRFDTYWGSGAEARTVAGGMAARGRAWLLLPVGTVARANGGTVAGRRLGTDEQALWRRVIADVRPLAPVRPVPPAPVAEPVAGPVVGPVGKPKTPPRPVPAASPPRAAAPRPSGPGETLDGGWDRRLRRGMASPDVTIDLHGYTLVQAHGVLETGLQRALADGARMMLLVTGKPPKVRGNALDRPGRGAIRAVIGDWLTGSAYASRIAAVRNAHPRHGGAGALYVILRRAREQGGGA